jgi:hypothetical protein
MGNIGSHVDLTSGEPTDQAIRHWRKDVGKPRVDAAKLPRTRTSGQRWADAFGGSGVKTYDRSAQSMNNQSDAAPGPAEYEYDG